MVWKKGCVVQHCSTLRWKNIRTWVKKKFKTPIFLTTVSWKMLSLLVLVWRDSTCLRLPMLVSTHNIFLDTFWTAQQSSTHIVQSTIFVESVGNAGSGDTRLNFRHKSYMQRGNYTMQQETKFWSSLSILWVSFVQTTCFGKCPACQETRTPATFFLYSLTMDTLLFLSLTTFPFHVLSNSVRIWALRSSISV